MKSRTVILFVFALLVCASCSKVESGAGSVAGGGGETVLSAAIAKAEVSKTWVDGKVTGSSLPVYWSDGDAINVNGQVSSPLSVPQGTKLSVAEFNMRSVRAPYSIIYPASIVRGEAYSAEGAIEVEIPDVQAYSPDSFATGAAVMYGYGDVEGAEVAMHGLCSVIRVTLKGTDQDAISQAGLTVSAQLEGEMAAMGLGRIYTFGPTFRAENSNTTRHAAEFWMIEPEIAFADLEDDMKQIIPYIEDKRVTDIAIGIGGELIVEGHGMGKVYTGIIFDDATFREAPIFDNGKSFLIGNKRVNKADPLSKQVSAAFSKAFSPDFILNKNYLKKYSSLDIVKSDLLNQCRDFPEPFLPILAETITRN